MTSIQPFIQLAALCVQKGIRDAIVCPGSRNALLTIAFTSNPSLKCKSISDERSAGFIALGQALATNKPTVLICTSGTAALNFHPAVAEAYFQKIPLLVITADRPPEWINQHEGQTVFQSNCYGKHVKKYFQWLPDQSSDAINYAERISNEAINLSFKSPIHLNIPIREPFYPDNEAEEIKEWRNIEIAEKTETISQNEINLFLEYCSKFKNRLLVIGQNRDLKLGKLANEFALKYGFELIADSISNCEKSIKNQDVFLKSIDEDDLPNLKPDFLITAGQSLISKSLKLFLRENKALEHWHIENDEEIIDPFVSITRKLEMNPCAFFENLNSLNHTFENEVNWKIQDKSALEHVDQYFKTSSFSEFHVLSQFMRKIKADNILHLGNSMSVRYINALSSLIPINTAINCNRGTSGIEGTLSTAVGHAMNTEEIVYCILGDVSFQYDKNALWNNYLPENLKIIVLNNAGGVIFQMIKGPKDQASFNEFFRTEQKHKADLIAEEFGLKYFSIRNEEEANSVLDLFIKSKGQGILEVFTDADENEKAFKGLFN